MSTQEKLLGGTSRSEHERIASGILDKLNHASDPADASNWATCYREFITATAIAIDHTEKAQRNEASTSSE